MIKIQYKIWLVWIVVCIIMYALGISNTIELYYQKQELLSKTEQLEGIQSKLQNLEAQKEKLKNIIDQTAIDSTLNKDNLIKIITQYCSDHAIRLHSIPKENSYEINGIKIESNALMAEGSYIELLKFIDYIESQKGIGTIVNVHFELNQDVITKKKKLQVKIYIESLISV